MLKRVSRGLERGKGKAGRGVKVTGPCDPCPDLLSSHSDSSIPGHHVVTRSGEGESVGSLAGELAGEAGVLGTVGGRVVQMLGVGGNGGAGAEKGSGCPPLDGAVGGGGGSRGTG